MKYNRLGNYIHKVNDRNKELLVETLLGVSIRKVFIPSIANTVGTNMKTYKIIKQHQFAYGPVTSRNGDKISVALQEEYSEAIVSQAYTVFDVNDAEELMPEYLMMWFRRPEFDRYARFKSHGSAREIFDWDELCETGLPLPNIEKQREIVKEYNTVTNRITLNEKLNEKLEETAQALYKHWFVDFDFPNKAGKPYKSSGGEMVYCEELEKEIPIEFDFINIGELVKTQYGYTASASHEIIGPKLLRITDITNDFIKWDTVPYCQISTKNYEKYKLNNGDILISRTGANSGYAKRIHKHFPKCVFASFLVRFTPIEKEYSIFLGLTIDNDLFKNFILSNAGGSAQPQANVPLLTSYQIIKPNKFTITKFNKVIERFLDSKEILQMENEKLKELQSLLLAKMTKVELEKV